MILLIVTTCLAASFSGSTGYNFHLMDTSSYSVFAPTFGYHLLLIDGGTLYYSGMSSETLTWLCRMLGYQSYSSYTAYSYTWMQSHPVRYRYLECSDSVVPQCRYKKYRSGYGSSLWLRCNARTQYGDTSSFCLVGKDKQHTQKEHGLLLYNGGTVSGNKFDDSTAELICQIMGFTGAMGWNIGRRYVEDQKDMRIRLNNLNCVTKDRPFPLCTYGTDTTNVTHEEDVWLWCDKPNTNNLVCPPGQKKYSSNKCIECSRNTYSSEPSESSSCTSCPSGSTSLPGSTQCSCAEGTYMSFGGQCLDCPGNSTSHKGSTFCTCVSGTFLYTDGTCVACPSGKISREGATNPSDCVRCPARSQPINNGQVCSCEKGYGWVWSTNMGELGYCTACPANFYKDKELGTCMQCPQEATSLPLSEVCECPSGMSWDGKSCVDCTAEGDSSGVCTCLAGTFWNGRSSQCDPCPTNHFSDKFSTICSKCRINSVSISQSASCSPCPKGSSWQNYTCTECFGNQVGNGVACTACPAGSVPLDTNIEACSCEKGYGWEWSASDEGSCGACPANFYKDKEQGTCIRCPHEATSLPLSEDCRCPIGLSWDGKSCVDCTTLANRSRVCTCLAGTYWNEPSSRCEDCPENHFSGDFFSVCSKCPIYTVSAGQSAECTSCPKGFFWNDHSCTECPENHIGNGATCSICPEGTSPSSDRSICQKSAVDILSVVSLTLCILLLVIVMGNLLITWKERRERAMTEDLQLAFQAASSTTPGKVRGRRCMCPSCPCSQPSKPALPSREVVEQNDVYANFS